MAGPSLDEDDVAETATDALVNGIDPRTGRYTVRPISPRVLSAIAAGRPLTPEELDEIAEALHRGKATLGVERGLDPNALDQVGWGVVFAADDPRVDEKKERLSRLLGRRRDEAGRLYREFVGADGLQAGEAGRKFLNRHGAAAGPVPVEKVPFYLLLAGSPAEIPFDVQCALDSRHAVGRLDFENPDALGAYANGLAAREAAAVADARRAAFFATSNPADVNTSRSAKRLARPLADTLAEKRSAWGVERRLQKEATKAALTTLLTGANKPSLFFSATHGLACELGDDTQRDRQGALVTQEWLGPATEDREMTPAEYFTASELDSTVDLRGMMAVLFACFGGGTPRYDEFLSPPGQPRIEIARASFVSRLAERMLTAGARAVVGHVDRAWSVSFLWPGAGAQIKAFEEVVLALADGWRVGAAVDVLHSRCNEISFELASALKDRGYGMQNDEEVAGLWLAQTDAANYVVLGDPAARLNV